jgi:chemotaxis protein methyltransferase CheR
MFRPGDHDADLSEEEFRLLRDFIHEQFGLYYDDGQRSSLRSRLAGRLSLLGLLSFEDYYRYLRFAPQRAEEIARMVSHLTNNETYFYRELPQLQVFAGHVLKSLKERKARTGERTLRVLSAGCSTGEEALTLAMIVYDSGQFFWNWDVKVFGMDLDAEVLEHAGRGAYHQNSLRVVAPDKLERHFVKDGRTVKVKESIRRLVTFRRGNLLEAESYEGLFPLDVIFCRNVLIYFSDASIRRTVGVFHERLAAGGYLFLGHAESLARITDAFTPIRFQGAMLYQKPEAAVAS